MYILKGSVAEGNMEYLRNGKGDREQRKRFQKRLDRQESREHLMQDLLNCGKIWVVYLRVMDSHKERC